MRFAKRFTAVLLFLITAYTFTSMAGTWVKKDNGWAWKQDDGSFAADGWCWCDGDANGIAECFYFNSEGICLQNTTTPDGYRVNADGAWIINDSIQTKSTATYPEATEKILNMLMEQLNKANTEPGVEYKREGARIWVYYTMTDKSLSEQVCIDASKIAYESEEMKATFKGLNESMTALAQTKVEFGVRTLLNGKIIYSYVYTM